MRLTRVVLLGGLGVVAYDVVASILARHFPLPYTRFVIGSYAIYLFTGYLAARRAPFWHGPLAGAAVAAVDAGLGWPLSAQLGPAGLAAVYASAPVPRIGWIVLIVAVGTALGLVGAGLAQIGRSRLGPTDA